jgi:hypothetical protein
MARPPASRLSSAKIVRQLREASRKGDRASLTLAVDQMRTLALSPRYWEKYLALLGNPLARLKGWKSPGRRARPRSASKGTPTSKGAAVARRGPGRGPRGRSSRRRPVSTSVQPSLFEL